MPPRTSRKKSKKRSQKRFSRRTYRSTTESLVTKSDKTELAATISHIKLDGNPLQNVFDMFLKGNISKVFQPHVLDKMKQLPASFILRAYKASQHLSIDETDVPVLDGNTQKKVDALKDHFRKTINAEVNALKNLLMNLDSCPHRFEEVTTGNRKLTDKYRGLECQIFVYKVIMTFCVIALICMIIIEQQPRKDYGPGTTHRIIGIYNADGSYNIEASLQDGLERYNEKMHPLAVDNVELLADILNKFGPLAMDNGGPLATDDGGLLGVILNGLLQ